MFGKRERGAEAARRREATERREPHAGRPAGDPPLGALAELRAAGAELRAAGAELRAAGATLPLARRPASAPAPAPAPAEARAERETPSTLDTPAAIRAYGEAMLVFARDREWAAARLADAHALLAPAARLNQVVIAKAPSADGALAPVGVAVWAKVDPLVDRRLKRLSAHGRRPQLDVAEWRSGETPWLIALAGAPGVREATCEKLAEILGRPALIETFAYTPQRA